MSPSSTDIGGSVASHSPWDADAVDRGCAVDDVDLGSVTVLEFKAARSIYIARGRSTLGMVGLEVEGVM